MLPRVSFSSQMNLPPRCAFSSMERSVEILLKVAAEERLRSEADGQAHDEIVPIGQESTEHGHRP